MNGKRTMKILNKYFPQKSILGELNKILTLRILIVVFAAYLATFFFVRTKLHEIRKGELLTFGEQIVRVIESEMKDRSYPKVESSIIFNSIASHYYSIYVEDDMGEVVAEIEYREGEKEKLEKYEFAISSKLTHSSVDSSQKQNLGMLYILVSNDDLYKFDTYFLSIGVFIALIVLLLVIVSTRKSINNTLSPLAMAANITTYDIDNIQNILKVAPIELVPLIEKINKGVDSKARIEMAEVIAHHLRNPTTIIKQLLKNSNIDEVVKKKIEDNIQVINDAANNLLSRNVEITKKEGVVFVDDLIQKSLSNKRDQYSSETIQFLYENEYSHSGLFVKFDSNQLAFIVDNLINNSVDAIRKKQQHFGEITIKSVKKNDFVVISVKDTGTGIKEKDAEQIFNEKYSTKNSSGVGLFHAKKTLTNNGGDIVLVENILNKGTTFEIYIPLTKQPIWYLNNLTFVNVEKVVIVDDESYFDEIWKMRLKEYNLEITYLRNSEELDGFLKLNKILNTVFFVDYHFSSSKNITGIDLIKKIKELNGRAYLVTSQSDKKEVREECSENAIRILPKSLIDSIPITSFELDINNTQLDYVEDNPKFQIFMEDEVEKYMNISVYNNPSQYLQELKNDGKRHIVFTDQNFGEDELTGVDFAKELKKIGQDFIVLLTCQEKQSITNQDLFVEVLEKKDNPGSIALDYLKSIGLTI